VVEDALPPPSWKLYDETTATGAIVDAIDGAQKVVNAEFFGLTDAGKGAQVVGALEGAARRGVEVNVVTDFISSMALPIGSYQRMRRKLEDAGASVVLTSRVPFSPRAKATPALKHVDHRKVVTVDGDKGFVGGMNFVPLTDEYQDTMVGLSGVDAARLAAEQLDRWTKVGGERTARHEQSVADALAGADAVTSDPAALRIVANAPDTERFELTDGYRDLIRNAKDRIWIATPAISDRGFARDLADAARRGVDVRLITSQKAPVAPAVGWVTNAHLADIVEAGGSAYQLPGILHRKALVADDETILSSFNLTGRSASHDHELGVRTKDPQFVDAIAGMLQENVDRSTQFDAADDHTGIGSKVGDLFARHADY
jgi:cardiolipin synthase